MSAPDAHEPIAERDAAGAAEYEKSDASVGSILKFGLGLLICILLVIGLVTGIQAAFTGRWPDFRPARFGLADNPNVPLPPAPRLEARPGQTLQELRANEQARLHSYGWADEEAGVVRIPIERAMELIIQRGLPARSKAEGAQFRDQGQDIPSDSSSGRRKEEHSP